MKPSDESAYPVAHTERLMNTLHELWTALHNLESYFVVVGGLVPQFLVPQTPGSELHCGTLDIDLAVSLAITGTSDGGVILQRIRELGFDSTHEVGGKIQRHVFVRQRGPQKDLIEFLAPSDSANTTTVRELDCGLYGAAVDGLDLAMIAPVSVKIESARLSSQVNIRVCSPWAFVVLKALAFHDRRERKDTYDLVYVLRHFSGGPAAVAQSVPNDRLGDPFVCQAIQRLETYFEKLDSLGCVLYRDFKPGVRPDAEARDAVREFLTAFRRR